MNLRRSLGAIVVVACAGVATATPGVAGQQPPSSGTAATTPGSYLNLQPRRRLPPGPLFNGRLLLEPGRLQSRTRMPQPRVVCGMTLLPGDAGVDPGIQARVSPRTARPTMRAVEPTICWDRGTTR